MASEDSKNPLDIIKYILLTILALLLAVIAYKYVSDDASNAKIMDSCQKYLVNNIYNMSQENNQFIRAFIF
jgi:hypothetical protein